MTAEPTPTAAPQPARPRRRWLQFSLRTLMLLVLLSAVGMWLGTKYFHRQRQLAAIDWVLAHGGQIEVAADDGHAALPPDWRERWLLPQVTRIDMTPPSVEPVLEPWSWLVQPKNLGDLEALADLNRVQELHLNFTQFSSSVPLAGLHELRVLDLSRSRIEDLRPLSRLPRLEVLDLSRVPDSDPRFSLLAGSWRPTPPPADYFLGFDLDISPLAEIANLRVLRLEGASIEDFAPLAELHNLEELDLSCTKIDDLSPLTELTGLKKLTLVWSLATPEEVEALRAALPNCEITYEQFAPSATLFIQ